ncbi:MAG TPA: GNAT family N-acetyltransferase [Phycicoccus sp.]|jgi:predicted GNAT family acetyltransferase|nr:GNAT family N-acetyltransferase [Phycicoccus sp.]HQK31184.1 GNAT family N-acetyltransferase [Phycicoccus sp.]HQV90532.1 GNAT family N-acetyltransferase [Phycicoccus sp.]HQY95909.1 GNAT family N-acetyltransferase [Phycicoccus sp.]HRA44791.1 GNAT family N-acetyltransferase [Phycicoccus sp.]
MADIDVTDNKDQDRFEARLDGELAGFAEYKLTSDLIVFTHTEVDPAFEGKGVGSALARHALDDVRERGNLKVLATCPFIKAWIGKHPEYIELLYGA